MNASDRGALICIALGLVLVIAARCSW